MQKEKLQKLWQEIQEINDSICSLRPINESLNKTLQERLRIEWTYNSNAIEGNTLTFGETAFFLREGLTSEGKPLKDFLEAKNHAEAIDVLEDLIHNKTPITEFFVKSLHGILLKGMGATVAKGRDGQYIQKKLYIGEYKKQPNHVLMANGKMHYYCEPVQVPGEMEKLLKWLYCEETQKLSSVEKSALLHYKFVTVHPFDDGNGRISRLLMNLILMQDGFPPCIIKNKNRRAYIHTLEKIRNGDPVENFVLFVAQELKESMVFMQKILSKKEVLINPFQTLNKEQRKDVIENSIGKTPISISQIEEIIPATKRATLKKDLKELLEEKRIEKTGEGRSVLYFGKQGG